jgi:hypothetical protein
MVPSSLQRHRDRRPSTPAGPGCCAMGTNKVKIIFCTGLTRVAKAGQNLFVPARRVQRTNQGRKGIICPLWVPISPQFHNSQQGPPLSILSDCQCTSCNGPGFDPSIRRHSGIWGAADEAVLNIVRTNRKNPPKKYFILSGSFPLEECGESVHRCWFISSSSLGCSDFYFFSHFEV